MTINGRTLIREPWEAKVEVETQIRLAGGRKRAGATPLLEKSCQSPWICETFVRRVKRQETGLDCRFEWDRKPKPKSKTMTRTSDFPSQPWHPFAMKYNLNQHSLITRGPRL